MHISFVRIVRDESGGVIDTQNADGDIRALRNQIARLREALEIEMQAVADLRELLDHARRLAVEAHDQLAGRD
jgi:hypothetical protein